MIYILITLLFVIFCFKILYEKEKAKKMLYTLLLFSLLSSEIYLLKIKMSQDSIFLSLPLHWCGLTNIILCVTIITKNRFTLKMLVIMIVGPVIALIYAQFSDLSSTRFILSHCLIIFSSVFLILDNIDLIVNFDQANIHVYNILFFVFILGEVIYPVLLNIIFDINISYIFSIIPFYFRNVIILCIVINFLLFTINIYVSRYLYLFYFRISNMIKRFSKKSNYSFED